MPTDCYLTNYDTEMITSAVENINNVIRRTAKARQTTSNWIKVKGDTQQTNLNSIRIIYRHKLAGAWITSFVDSALRGG